MRIVYSDKYAIDIGAHVFPVTKYDRIRSLLAGMPIWEELEFVEPVECRWEDIGLVHSRDYIAKLRAGRLSISEQAEMELPWSSDVVEGFSLMVGGTITAARLAFDARGGAPAAGLVVHLGGGFHHAFPDHGEGFCMFNDVAVAVRVLARDAGLERVAVIDCDVHHGNGTAAIFADDPGVFTFSIHQRYNYPAVKPRSSLDVALVDGVSDVEYLRALTTALPRVFDFQPQLVFYLAGADPFEDDQLGGLSLTLDGLRKRDRVVLEAIDAARVPGVVTLAGGYARHGEDTVAAHAATVEEVLAIVRRARSTVR
ncbi:MAG: histone deacetylase [Acidobacteria bacterium]|nr:MAG: histone deacetylase [Acidobacteriota bacterium]